MATEEVLVLVMQADFLFVIVDNKGYPKETLKAVSKSVNRELRHAINRARAARARTSPQASPRGPRSVTTCASLSMHVSSGRSTR